MQGKASPVLGDIMDPLVAATVFLTILLILEFVLYSRARRHAVRSTLALRISRSAHIASIKRSEKLESESNKIKELVNPHLKEKVPPLDSTAFDLVHLFVLQDRGYRDEEVREARVNIKKATEVVEKSTNDFRRIKEERDRIRTELETVCGALKGIAKTSYTLLHGGESTTDANESYREPAGDSEP